MSNDAQIAALAATCHMSNYVQKHKSQHKYHHNNDVKKHKSHHKYHHNQLHNHCPTMLKLRPYQQNVIWAMMFRNIIFQQLEKLNYYNRRVDD